jgi:hypothetical protein
VAIADFKGQTTVQKVCKHTIPYEWTVIISPCVASRWGSILESFNLLERDKIMTISELKGTMNFLKKWMIVGLLLLCQNGRADEIELPASFPFFAQHKQVPLTGEPSTIPSDLDKHAILFVFRKISESHYEPLGSGFIVDVPKIHFPHIFVPLPFIGRPTLIYHQWYFVTARHVLFDESGMVQDAKQCSALRALGICHLSIL